MKFRALWIAGIVIAATAGQVQAGVVLTTNRAGFEGSGSIAYNSNFSDFGTGFSSPSNPFTRGDVTYASGNNIVVGTGTFYLPVQNMIFYNFWTPMIGSIAPGYNMFGFDTGVISSGGSNSLVNVQVTTNMGLYNFNGLTVSKAETALDFLGFTTTLPGEEFAAFRLSTQNGSGWAAGMTNVDVGNTSAAVPEPSSIAMFGVGALGLIFARRKRHQTKLAT